MKESIEWLIQQYIRNVEEMEQEAKDQKLGACYLTGQMITYKKVIIDLQEILNENRID